MPLGNIVSSRTGGLVCLCGVLAADDQLAAALGEVLRTDGGVPTATRTVSLLLVGCRVLGGAAGSRVEAAPGTMGAVRVLRRAAVVRLPRMGTETFQGAEDL